MEEPAEAGCNNILPDPELLTMIPPVPDIPILNAISPVLEQLNVKFPFKVPV